MIVCPLVVRPEDLENITMYFDDFPIESSIYRGVSLRNRCRYIAHVIVIQRGIAIGLGVGIGSDLSFTSGAEQSRLLEKLAGMNWAC